MGVVSGLALQGNFDPNDFRYVFVVPDVHGDFDALLRTLHLAYSLVEPPGNILDYETFAVDVKNRVSLAEQASRPRKRKLDDLEHELALGGGSVVAEWAPGEDLGPRLSSIPGVLFVQLGDVVDRGPESAKCLILVRIISEIMGWTLARLYGNHEVINHLNAATKYIHPREASVLEKMRGQLPGMETGGFLWKTITDTALLVARLGNPSDLLDDPTTPLAELPPLDQASVLFVHAGIDLTFLNTFASFRPINRSTGGVDIDSLTVVDKLNFLTHWMLTEPDLDRASLLAIFRDRKQEGPLWNRDLYGPDAEFVCDELLPPILKFFKVARIMVGHTPMENRRMLSSCGSRLVLADAAISKWIFKPFKASTADDDHDINPATGQEYTSNPAVLAMELAPGGRLKSINAFYKPPADNQEMYHETLYTFEAPVR